MVLRVYGGRVIQSLEGTYRLYRNVGACYMVFRETLRRVLYGP